MGRESVRKRKDVDGSMAPYCWPTVKAVCEQCVNWLWKTRETIFVESRKFQVKKTKERGTHTQLDNDFASTDTKHGKLSWPCTHLTAARSWSGCFCVKATYLRVNVNFQIIFLEAQATVWICERNKRVHMHWSEPHNGKCGLHVAITIRRFRGSWVWERKNFWYTE